MYKYLDLLHPFLELVTVYTGQRVECLSGKPVVYWELSRRNNVSNKEQKSTSISSENIAGAPVLGLIS